MELTDFIRYFWVPAVGYIMWEYRNFKTQTDNQVQTLREKVVKLEAESVTEEQLRRIISDQFSLLHNDQRELKQSMNEIREGLVELKIKIARGAGDVHS